MITNAIVKKGAKQLEIFAKDQTKPAAFLPLELDGLPVKFIAGWDDIMGIKGEKKPIRLNGGKINHNLMGNSTLVRGFYLQCGEDNTVYVVMDPALL
jgi:hypothetical protein